MTAVSFVAEHRPTVLLHLYRKIGPQTVTATELAAEHPELDVDRWALVLDHMASIAHPGDTARSLYRVDHIGPAFALGREGYADAQRLAGDTEGAGS